MRRQPILAVVLLLVCAAPPMGTAQESGRGVENPVTPADSIQRANTASILFDHNLNTYYWIGRAALDTTVERFRVGLLEQYASNIIQLEGTPGGGRSKLQSSQQSLSLVLRRPATDELTPQAQWNSFTYLDNKGTGLNNASTRSLLGGMDYTPWPWLLLTPMAGYRWDTQAGIPDQGTVYSLSALVPWTDADGYHVTGNAQYREDLVSPRKLEWDFARISLQKAFSPLTRDSLELGFNHSRREFYAPADSNIESRIEQVFLFANKLEYDFDPSLTSTFFVSIYDRGLDKDLRNWNAVNPPELQFNTRIDEFRLDSYVQAAYWRPESRSGGWIRLSHSERTEAHAVKRPSTTSPATELLFSERSKQEQTKDHTIHQTALSGAGELPVSSSDRLGLSGSISILRYDTPSEQNVEDRDELLVAVGLSTAHRLSTVLSVEVILSGTLSHLVYLLKERSANNNFNRVLRLSPRTTFQPVPWITTVNTFEVLANYTVYDFEQQLPSVRSFSYRQWGWMDSTAFDVTHHIGFDVYAYWRVYERGQLQWQEFLERVESSASEQTYAVQCRAAIDRSASFAIGIRSFGQSRYTYLEGRKKLDTYLSSVGPTCTISWDPGPHSRIQFQGWYEHRREPNGTTRSLANMTMNIYVKL